MEDQDRFLEKREEAPKQKSPMGPAALTLGIISIVAMLFWYVSLPTGILAIIFGVKAYKKEKAKLGRAGMILGIIGLSLVTLVYIWLAGAITIFG